MYLRTMYVCSTKTFELLDKFQTNVLYAYDLLSKKNAEGIKHR